MEKAYYSYDDDANSERIRGTVQKGRRMGCMCTTRRGVVYGCEHERRICGRKTCWCRLGTWEQQCAVYFLAVQKRNTSRVAMYDHISPLMISDALA